METMEKRTYKNSNIEIETREDGPPVIRGHAAVFDIIESGGWFREKVAPGAFRISLQEDDIRALWNHDSKYVLGRNRANTLKLWEDERGLAVEISPPDTQQAMDFIELIRRGDVSQMSFGFQVKRSTWIEEKDEDDLRVLDEVKLWEVSPVTFPFYKDTDIGIKAEYRAWRDSMTPPVKKISKYYNKQRRHEISLHI